MFLIKLLVLPLMTAVINGDNLSGSLFAIFFDLLKELSLWLRLPGFYSVCISMWKHLKCLQSALKSLSSPRAN